MIGRKQVFKSFVGAVRGIAVAGRVRIFETEARRGPRIGQGVAALDHCHETLVVETLRCRTEPTVAKVAKLARRFDRVIPMAELAGQ